MSLLKKVYNFKPVHSSRGKKRKRCRATVDISYGYIFGGGLTYTLNVSFHKGWYVEPNQKVRVSSKDVGGAVIQYLRDHNLPGYRVRDIPDSHFSEGVGEEDE